MKRSFHLLMFMSVLSLSRTQVTEFFTTALEMTTEATTVLPGSFYSFGSAAGDLLNPAADDGSSSVIPLLSPFQYFGLTYQQIYVNNNGFLTFNQASSQFAPNSFPANGSQDVIAGLWTNIDNSARGVVSYNQYTSGSVLASATQDINNYFPNLTFTASWVFVATWDKVAYFNSNTETSFQVVLISGSGYSFILMNYGDVAATGYPVQAGYDTAYSTDYFVISGSDSGSSISDLKTFSNVNVPGRYVFRVDTGSNTNKNEIVGLQGRLASFLDLADEGNKQIVLQQIQQELVKKGLPSNMKLTIKKVEKMLP
ncbi:sushi, nidogen and EGF-like domain-containing protein 1 [Danio rerio]|uniref:Sushi, nidogen and EGF-like domain-containing protein 1 n=2 Tax=Danio rerio TaxID=7955 RepID=A0AC58GZ40_DANRE